MKPHVLSILFFSFISFFLHAQEWRQFKASDAVNDFELKDKNLWVISASGLTKIDTETEQQTNWNTFNSDLPDYRYDRMAVDNSGGVWLGKRELENITVFDGTNWETLTEINGNPIRAILDIKATPDGKVWLYGAIGEEGIYYFENDEFVALPPPADSLVYYWGFGTDANSHVWAKFIDTSFTNQIIGEYDGNEWILHDLAALGYDFGNGSSKFDFVYDSQGNIYALAGKWGDNFLKYDGTDWTYSAVPADMNNWTQIARPISIDSEDNIWISLRHENSFLKYDGTVWDSINLENIGLKNGYADGLVFDESGSQRIIYVQKNENNGYRRTELYKYDGTYLTQTPLANSALPTNYLNKPVIDYQNNKWFSTRRGLVRFDGRDWDLIGYPPFTDYAYHIHPDLNGNIWLNSYNSYSDIERFDGVTFTKVPVRDSLGMPFNYMQDIIGHTDGNVYIATHWNTIAVLDKRGNFSYLKGFLGGSHDIEFDKEGRLYVLGILMNRLENGEWTEIELTGMANDGHTFTIAPNGHIWMAYSPSAWLGDNITVWNGSWWKNYESDFEWQSLPKWDSQGYLWMNTNEGFCKQVGDDWICFNESNSPLTAGSILDFEIDKSDNFWISLHDGGLLLFNELEIHDIFAENMPSIAGCVYRDFNQDETKDDSDVPFAGHKIMLLPDSLVTFSNSDGSYRFFVPPGDYEVKYIPILNWNIDNSAHKYSVTHSNFDLEGLDFRIKPNEEICDLEIHVKNGSSRCNAKSYFTLTYQNKGTLIETGEVRFFPDPLTEFIESDPPPSFFDGDTLVWDFDGLYPSQSDMIRITLQMPDETFTDEKLTSFASVDHKNGADVLRKDSEIIEQTILCSYDPNDKKGKSAGETTNGQSLFRDPIEYLIRFQNTGNDTAFTVVVRDTLDENLDLTTFEILAVSHEYDFRMESNGAVEFRFDDILLPDSTTNEPASHGFIQYRISTKEDLPSPTLIENTAHIYFDFNGAIVTNTTGNELIQKFNGIFSPNKADLNLNTFPNPASNEIFVKVESPNAERFRFNIFDSKGILILTGKLSGNELKNIELEDLPSGMYWLNVENEEKAGSVRFVKR